MIEEGIIWTYYSCSHACYLFGIYDVSCYFMIVTQVLFYFVVPSLIFLMIYKLYCIIKPKK